MNPNLLAGKTIIVTGGSDGLGAASAKHLASEGANVVICARGPERLQRVAQDITNTNGSVLAVQTDVCNPDDLARLVTETTNRFGRIDGLVNNAGKAASLPFENIGDQAWQDDLDLKFMAAVRLSRLVVPIMRQHGGGSIVNVLAIGGKTPSANSMPSSVSRAAGLALGKAMSKDLGRDNIRVNGVLIGFVESDQWVRFSSLKNQSLQETYAGLVAQHNIPLGRVGRAEEFADLIAFLLSDRASYITGTAINFDGGASAAH